MCRGHLYGSLYILTLPSVGGKPCLGFNNQKIGLKNCSQGFDYLGSGNGGKKTLHSIILSWSLPKSPNTVQKLRVCAAEQTWGIQCLWDIPLPWDCLVWLPNPSITFSLIVSQCWVKICAVAALVFTYLTQKGIFIGILLPSWWWLGWWVFIQDY